ncbi:MAG: hypothetical protein U0768_09585 [Anaerolineae bacterium]
MRRVLVITVLALLLALGTLGTRATTTAAAPSAPLSTITVTTTSDTIDAASGVCANVTVASLPGADGVVSLREAICAANNNAGADTIEFDIRASGAPVCPATIAPTSQLPTITDQVTINGYTQGGATPNSAAIGFNGALCVELSGVNATSSIGLFFQAVQTAPNVVTKNPSNSIVKGLVINRFRRAIQIDGDGGGANPVVPPTGIGIYGNFLGTDTTGLTDVTSSTSQAIRLEGANATLIGSSQAADRNIISGYGAGILINQNSNPFNSTYAPAGRGGGSNVITNNYIGTDKTGLAALGHTGAGIAVQGPDNQILTNVIAGNAGDGIQINEGNCGNIVDGVTNTTGYAATHNTVISGNLIGVGADGTTALGNAGYGVYVTGSNDNIIGQNRSGSGAGNTIANNGGTTKDGIAIVRTTKDSATCLATGNVILTNAIYNNAGLGIDLSDDGVTPNDSQDPDSGPNNLQNFPVLATAVSGGATTTVTGTLNSLPNRSFLIQFFANTACDPSGYGEGKTFLGQTVVTTDTDGDATINATGLTGVPPGQFVTSTATRLADPQLKDGPNHGSSPGLKAQDDFVALETSEFSACVQVTGTADLSVTKSVGETVVRQGGQATFTITVTNAGPTDAPDVQVLDTLPSGVNFVSATPSQGTCDTSALPTITCQLGTVAINESATVTVVVTAPTVGQFTNSVTVSSSANDPNLNNNTARATFRVVKPGNQGSQGLTTGSTYVQLPVLGYIGNTKAGVDWTIEAQNVGSTWTKIALLLFAENSGFCQPQAQNPFKIECTGLLKPGTSWVWTSSQLPSSAKSAIAISYNPFPQQGNIWWRCEDWTNSLNKLTWPEGWPSVNSLPGQFPFNWNPFDGQPIAVEVVRKMPGNATPSFVMADAYSGLSAMQEGRYDPIFGGFAYYAPVAYSGYNGWNSWLYIQNSGTECTSIELWFKDRDSCLRAQICSVAQVSPGYSAQFNVAGCAPPGFTGSAWIRASQPLGIVVDQIGQDVLMSYTGVAAELCYVFNGQCLDAGGGSQVAYGPLIYRETNGWATVIHVQNMSSIVAAKVKVYFVDQSGDIITTLVDWICPRGETEFPLALVNNLPGQYVGAVRVESQAWESPGDPAVNAVPIAAVAELLNYSSPTKITQATAYNLFPEDQGYYWQIGQGDASGLQGGVAVIGIPSLMQRGNAYNMVTDISVQNLVPKPGFTDFVMYVYDQNGLLDYVCEKLNEKQVEYINLANWNWIQPGFVGSAVISAVYWEHDVLSTPVPCDSQAPEKAPSQGCVFFVRNVVGLAAVKVERVVPGGAPAAGDVTAASEGFPIPPGFDFEGYIPQCPGVPTSCAPVDLIITVCDPNYERALVIITDEELGNIIPIESRVGPGGVVQIPATVPGPNGPINLIVSGRRYRIRVGNFDGVDFLGSFRSSSIVRGIGIRARIPAFDTVILVPCQSGAAGDVAPLPYAVTLTPPVGVIEGYEVVTVPAVFPVPPTDVPGGYWPGAPLNPMAGDEIQLWLPPTVANQAGTYLQTVRTNTEGYFKFNNVNPCLIYELKFTGNNAVTVLDGILATIPGEKYIVSPLAPYIQTPGPQPLAR